MFSVVVPLFNKEDSIGYTLNSVLQQSFNEYEIIIIDDGSTDSSENKVHEFLQLNPGIRYIKKQNEGVSSARNEGIKLAKYEFLAFLDADDIWEPSYLAEQNKLISDFPDASMWGMNYDLVSEEITQKLYTGLPKNYQGYVADYFSLKRISDLFCSSSVVVRKNAFDVAGMFDTRIKYSEDLDMWYRIILNFPVVFDARILVHYIQDADNRAITTNRPLKEFLPFYLSKYDRYCEDNPVFSHFIHTLCATNLISYYFNPDKEVREMACNAVMHLRYDEIHFKFRLLYKFPYFAGHLFLLLLKFKQRIWEKYGFRFRFLPSNHSRL